MRKLGFGTAVVITTIAMMGCPGDDGGGDDGGDTVGPSSGPGTTSATPTTTDASGPATSDSSGGPPPATSSDGGSSTTDGATDSTGGETTGGALMCGEGLEACEAAHAAFAACGGDPTGTWAISTLCTLPQGQDNPDCPGMFFRLGVVTGSGDVEIDATTISYTNYVVDPFGYGETPSECIFPPGGTCADVETITLMQWDQGCCEDVAGVCTCHASSAGEPGDFSGMYTVNGNEITIEGAPQEFCVDGDTLSILSGPSGRPGTTLTVMDRVN